jgi:release factor glutamine methyltransferase
MRLPRGARVLDLCSGSGAVAVHAARRGEVTDVDVSRRAVLTIRLNALVSNPPYVPSHTDVLPTRGPERAWDAGRNGRTVLDRICASASDHLRPGRVLLVVQSSLLGFEATADALETAGLEVDLAALERGPLMRASRDAGLIPPVAQEDVLLVRGASRLPPIAGQGT